MCVSCTGTAWLHNKASPNCPLAPCQVTRGRLAGRSTRQAQLFRWVEPAHAFLLSVLRVQVRTNSLIVATGALAKRLGIPNEEVFWSSGISACAICDGASHIFRNKARTSFVIPACVALL